MWWLVRKVKILSNFIKELILVRILPFPKLWVLFHRQLFLLPLLLSKQIFVPFENRGLLGRRYRHSLLVASLVKAVFRQSSVLSKGP